MEIHDRFRFNAEVDSMKQQLQSMKKKKKGFLGHLSRADKDHNERIEHCRTVLNTHMGGNRNFILQIDGKPAGVLSMSVPPAGSEGGSGVKIHGLMSLPGTKGVGRQAIEQAVQMSLQEGRRGRVDLEFLEFSNSHAVYQKLGFIDNGSWDKNTMYLSPDKAQQFLQDSAGRSPSFV